MASLSDYTSAIKMRQILQDLIEREIERRRPKPRYATVESVNYTTRKAAVVYPGEINSVSLPYGVAVPTTVGQLVRVDGPLGDRYISDVLGVPATPYAQTFTAFFNGTVDVNGNALIVHNIPSLHLRARLVQCFFKGNSSEMKEMVFSFIDGTNVYFNGGTAGRLYRCTVTYTAENHPDW